MHEPKPKQPSPSGKRPHKKAKPDEHPKDHRLIAHPQGNVERMIERCRQMGF